MGVETRVLNLWGPLRLRGRGAGCGVIESCLINRVSTQSGQDHACQSRLVAS